MPRPRKPAPAADMRAAVIGILSRPGDLDTMADEICEAVARLTRRTPEAVQRCQAPEDPHTGTALVGGQCPICHWRPA